MAVDFHGQERDTGSTPLCSNPLTFSYFLCPMEFEITLSEVALTWQLSGAL